MNPIETARLRVQSLLARGLATTGPTDDAGVRGASEIWGGVSPREKAGWYLWLRENIGAYGLDLESAEVEGGAGGPFLRAQLSIRYYPSPTDAQFGCFSPEERAIASGGWLDATGAPDVLRADAIPAALFVIGVLELGFDSTGSTALVSVGALDRMREVPAWRLTLPLFTAIGGMIAQVDGRCATRLVETVDLSHRTALLLFDPTISPCKRGPLPFVDTDTRIVRDVALTRPPPCDALAGAGSQLPIARSWFVSGAPPPQALGCCR